ncbi:MAG: hypothetical protein DMG81_07305 [Acidobacteria bacterium]|nr:MAG: hypothetical protein DMG81_07305 [Acidobacteriota bacterium]
MRDKAMMAPAGRIDCGLQGKLPRRGFQFFEFRVSSFEFRVSSFEIRDSRFEIRDFKALGYTLTIFESRFHSACEIINLKSDFVGMRDLAVFET